MSGTGERWQVEPVRCRGAFADPDPGIGKMTGGAGPRRVALATLLLLCCPSLVEGQHNQGRPDQRVSARASVLYKVTRLAGGTHFLVGARAAVVFAGGLEIGGAGIKLIESVDISLGPGNMLELRTGYGGITLSKTNLLGSPVGAGILLGAGNAEVRSPPVGTSWAPTTSSCSSRSSRWRYRPGRPSTARSA